MNRPVAAVAVSMPQLFPFCFTLGVLSAVVSRLNEQFSLHLEIWQGDEWVSAWGPALPECLSPPIEIVPGETYATTLHVFGGYPRNNVYPKFQVEPIEGDYRIVITSTYWDYDHDGPSWGEEPPLEFRVSNTFELRSR